MKEPRVKRRRRRRGALSLDAEIRQSARQIYESGFADAMKAAALVIAARKLDEVKMLLLAGGLNGGTSRNATHVAVTPSAQPPPATPPPVQNPCVTCGRTGVYRTKPNQFNRTGSWYCRTHMVLGTNQEAEDRFDRTMSPAAAPPPPIEPVIAPGASSLTEAMGLAELVNEETDNGA